MMMRDILRKEKTNQVLKHIFFFIVLFLLLFIFIFFLFQTLYFSLSKIQVNVQYGWLVVNENEMKIMFYESL